MQELIVALHMHTVYSDGTGKHAELAAAGLKAGVDVLIVTDHNVLVNDIEGYTQDGKRRLLLLAGEKFTTAHPLSVVITCSSLGTTLSSPALPPTASS